MRKTQETRNPNYQKLQRRQHKEAKKKEKEKKNKGRALRKKGKNKEKEEDKKAKGTISSKWLGGGELSKFYSAKLFETVFPT